MKRLAVDVDDFSGAELRTGVPEQRDGIDEVRAEQIELALAEPIDRIRSGATILIDSAAAGPTAASTTAAPTIRRMISWLITS